MKPNDELAKSLLDKAPDVARRYLRQTYKVSGNSDQELIISALLKLKISRPALQEKDRYAIEAVKQLAARTELPDQFRDQLDHILKTFEMTEKPA